MKIAVVYWSSTGNTEAMANAVLQGAKDAGAQAELLTAAEFDAAKAAQFDAFAFGCPAMGAEELEDSEFQPMWEAVSPTLGDKKVSLFGSYGWGDGEWMNTWKENAPCKVEETYICQDLPGEAEEEACRALGAHLAQ